MGCSERPGACRVVRSDRRWNHLVISSWQGSPPLRARLASRSFCTSLWPWENKVYVEKTFIEWPVCTNAELLLDIVRSSTWYWHGRSQRNDFDCGDERRGKSGDGVDHRNQGEHHPAVYPGSTR